MIADSNTGERGTAVNTAELTEGFYRDTLGLDFEKIWMFPVQNDIRRNLGGYPVFRGGRELMEPKDGLEWYWFGVNKRYEDF
jgi:hypothetical protein